MFNTAAFDVGGADGGPLVGGITITNLNISAPAAADTEPPVITLIGENPVISLSVMCILMLVLQLKMISTVISAV